jgi:arginase
MLDQFDVDSMDPDSVSWGTGTPVKNGLTDQEALILNTELIKHPKVKSWEMVEINPLLDTENKMAETSLKILKNVLNHLN